MRIAQVARSVRRNWAVASGAGPRPIAAADRPARAAPASSVPRAPASCRASPSLGAQQWSAPLTIGVRGKAALASGGTLFVGHATGGNTWCQTVGATGVAGAKDGQETWANKEWLLHAAAPFGAGYAATGGLDRRGRHGHRQRQAGEQGVRSVSNRHRRRPLACRGGPERRQLCRGVTRRVSTPASAPTWARPIATTATPARPTRATRPRGACTRRTPKVRRAATLDRSARRGVARSSRFQGRSADRAARQPGGSLHNLAFLLGMSAVHPSSCGAGKCWDGATCKAM